MTISVVKRTPKVPLMMRDEEITLIDDWRFKNRFTSSVATIRGLLSRGSSTTQYGEQPTTSRKANLAWPAAALFASVVRHLEVRSTIWLGRSEGLQSPQLEHSLDLHPEDNRHFSACHNSVQSRE